jgi:hypothetical protein
MAQKLEYELKGKSDVEQVTGRAKKSVDSLGASFRKAGTDIGNKIAGMFAATVLFDKALGFVTNTFRDLAQVADQVDRSGISAEQFQRLAYAAQQSGVSVAALAKATRQLRVDMAEAAAGDAKKLEMFKALGITMEQLRSGDAASVFLAISSALSGSADDSERLLITTAFFGDKIGNDILPLLSDFRKLSADIADAPIVDEKTLALIAKYDDGLDRLNSKLKMMVGHLVAAYDKYSKWASKMAEDIATGLFDFLDFIPGFRGRAAGAVVSAAPLMPLTYIGADGSTPIERARGATTSGADKVKNDLLALLRSGVKTEKDKAADTKSTSASSVSGSVIGVGQNPVVTALQEQQGIAREQLACLQVIAGRTNGAAVDPNLTNKGATPSTPASGGRV